MKPGRMILSSKVVSILWEIAQAMGQAFKRADFKNGAVPHCDCLSNRLARLHCVDIARRVHDEIAHNSPPRPAPMLSCCFMVAKRGNLSAFN